MLANAMSMQDDNDPERNNEVDELNVNETTKEMNPDAQSLTSSKSDSSAKNETSQLMNIQSSPKSNIKVSGTLKLMKPFEVQPYSKYKDFDEVDSNSGCFPTWVIFIWSNLFD